MTVTGKMNPDGTWNTPTGKHPGGCPLEYKPEYCQIAVDLGKQGKSYSNIAARLDITRVTLYEWRDRYPEFASALSQAREYAQAWWEDLGQDGCTMGKQFNAQGYSLQVRNRFPEDWRERTEQVVETKKELSDPTEAQAMLSALITELLPHLQRQEGGKVIDITPKLEENESKV